MVEITEIRIKLMEGSEDRLRAFCSITIDQNFVVRDLKIIDGTHGPFVAMPSRKLTGHCQNCGSKNHLRANFCNQCGTKQSGPSGTDGPQKLYADVAHPINSECREMIQKVVITEFDSELNRAAQPGYRSRYDDDFDAGDYDSRDYPESTSSRVAAQSDTGDDAETFSATTRPPKDATLADSSPPGTPQPRRRVQPGRSHVPSDELPVTKNTDFGAGLFDDVPETENSDAIVRTDSDARLVRVEHGDPGRAVPTPHTSDESSRREGAGFSSDDTAATHAKTADDADESGFGVGVFDD